MVSTCFARNIKDVGDVDDTMSVAQLTRQANSEEIKGIPSPTQKSTEEHHPVHESERSDDFQGIWRTIERWFEGWDSRPEVFTYTHLLTVHMRISIDMNMPLLLLLLRV